MLVKLNEDFSNLEETIISITYSDNNIEVEYGHEWLPIAKIYVPIATFTFDTPLKTIRGIYNLKKVYMSGKNVANCTSTNLVE